MSTRITWLGHSTVEIEEEGVSLLTDPVFSNRIFRLKRLSPLPIDPGKIRQPAAILVSHAHYDHLDIPTLKFIRTDVPVILPEELASLVKKFVPNPLIELPHGTTHPLSKDISITAFPVRHRGFRILPFRFNVCNGYLINFKGKKIFFPGDTGIRDFRDLSQTIDLALLPISCYQPEWVMKGRHLNPAEALRIFGEIGANHMIPIHWGTFKLSTEPVNEPLEWLNRLTEEEGLTDRVHPLNPGEDFLLD